MISRRKAREFAMQALYASEAGGDAGEAAGSALLHDEPVAADTRDYGLRLARIVRERTEEIDRLIVESSENWDLERLAMVDRAILRVSIAELMTQADVPPKVCINEAVEIARKFSTEDSSRFVNGVLDAVSRKLGRPPADARDTN
jgi:N utilization substance protein B